MRYLFAAAVAVLLPISVQAENLALVIANARYDTLSDVRAADAADAASEALADAGFAVVEIRDERFAGAVSALAAERGRIAEADRLLILVAGHFASGAGQSWLLSRDAREPDDLSVGAQALPLGALMAMAAGHPGAAAVLIADDGGRVRLGPGLSPGAEAGPAPQGVTVLLGPMRGLITALEDGLLVEGRSLAATVADLPASVSASGFVSDAVAFRPAGEGIAAEPVQPEPVRPVETPETIEANLGLDRDARRAVQRDLSILGHDPRGIDGIFGRGSRAAIASWQTAQGFDATGFLTGNQIALLQDQGAERARQLEAEAAARQAEQDRLDSAYWRETGADGGEAGLRAYLERYPDGLFADLARERLAPFEEARRASAARAEREFWDEVRDADTPAAFRRYLETYPEGAFRQDAEARLAELEAEARQEDTTAEARAEEGRVAGSAITRLLVEQRLRQLGVDPGRIDGNFDEETRRAIRRFQRARDLPVTGYVTRATLVRLLASG